MKRTNARHRTPAPLHMRKAIESVLTLEHLIVNRQALTYGIIAGCVVFGFQSLFEHVSLLTRIDRKERRQVIVDTGAIIGAGQLGALASTMQGKMCINIGVTTFLPPKIPAKRSHCS